MFYLCKCLFNATEQCTWIRVLKQHFYICFLCIYVVCLRNSKNTQRINKKHKSINKHIKKYTKENFYLNCSKSPTKRFYRSVVQYQENSLHQENSSPRKSVWSNNSHESIRGIRFVIKKLLKGKTQKEINRRGLQ